MHKRIGKFTKKFFFSENANFLNNIYLWKNNKILMIFTSTSQSFLGYYQHSKTIINNTNRDSVEVFFQNCNIYYFLRYCWKNHTSLCCNRHLLITFEILISRTTNFFHTFFHCCKKIKKVQILKNFYSWCHFIITSFYLNWYVYSFGWNLATEFLSSYLKVPQDGGIVIFHALPW